MSNDCARPNEANTPNTNSSGKIRFMVDARLMANRVGSKPRDFFGRDGSPSGPGVLARGRRLGTYAAALRAVASVARFTSRVGRKFRRAHARRADKKLFATRRAAG